MFTDLLELFLDGITQEFSYVRVIKFSSIAFFFRRHLSSQKVQSVMWKYINFVTPTLL